MPRERVLISVKTYPTLSQSYIELVCTAGFKEDGTWVRIYPVPFRLLEEKRQFTKWTWVELPLMKRQKDDRPESFSPTDRNDIEIGAFVNTNDDWRERRKLVLEKGRVWTNLTALIEAGKRNEVSLATFKPHKMVSFEWQKSGLELDPSRLEAVRRELKERDLLDDDGMREDFKPVLKLPYDFYYKFCDDNGRECKLRILDWEIGSLYWKCLKAARNNEACALEGVRQKYGEDFLKKDLYLFLGTTFEWHKRAPNPWTIIGVFYPPNRRQLELDI